MVNKQNFMLERQGSLLSYQVQGQGVPVIFIQGVGVHGSGWKPQVDTLASQYCCLSFDNRGIGASQPIVTKLTIEQMAEDTKALMDAQKWDSAHIVGHSMGGVIALHLALSASKRVRSLSLLCTFAKGSDATKLSPWMLWVGMRSRIGTRRMRRHAFLEIVMPKEILVKKDRDKLAEELEPIFGHDLAEQPPIVMKQLSAMQSYDATAQLGQRAELPTLVVAAKHDKISPPQVGQAIAKAIVGSRYVEIAEAAHGAPIQCADRINNLLIEHFSKADNK